jgi:hypothetical protein
LLLLLQRLLHRLMIPDLSALRVDQWHPLLLLLLLLLVVVVSYQWQLLLLLLLLLLLCNMLLRAGVLQQLLLLQLLGHHHAWSWQLLLLPHAVAPNLHQLLLLLQQWQLCAAVVAAPMKAVTNCHTTADADLSSRAQQLRSAATNGSQLWATRG